MSTTPDVLRLTRVIIELDAHMPRGKEMADTAPRPAWCHVFCEAMDSPGGECCGHLWNIERNDAGYVG